MIERLRQSLLSSSRTNNEVISENKSEFGMSEEGAREQRKN